MVVKVTIETVVLPGERVRVGALNATDTPVAPEGIVAVRFTVPVNPRLARVIVDVDELPEVILKGEGTLAAIAKSAFTLNDAVALWERVALVARTLGE